MKYTFKRREKYKNPKRTERRDKKMGTMWISREKWETCEKCFIEMRISGMQSAKIKDICAREKHIVNNEHVLWKKIDKNMIHMWKIRYFKKNAKKLSALHILYAYPDSRAATRTHADSYSSRAYTSSHSRKLAAAQTERSVAATSTVLVTESVLSSTSQHCYWICWESQHQETKTTRLSHIT